MTQAARARETGNLHFAVVGAGVAGMTCARELVARGYRVTVFEARGAVGGRLASLRLDAGLVDVGAQYLTVQGETFANEVRRWVGADLLRSWEPVLAELDNGRASTLQATMASFVGVPTMQSLAEFLALNLEIVLDTAIGRIARGSTEWFLFDTRGRQLGIAGFDGVVVAIPSIDALVLVRDQTDLADVLEAVQWDACWSASLTLSRPSGIEFDGAFINDDPILAWAARESSKPLRVMPEGVAERWVLQARSSWSNSFAAMAPDDAARWMQRAFAARLARPMAQKSCAAVLWRAGFPATRCSWCR